jgi:transcriptional regulator with XRE-family HTH domain
LKSFGTVLSSLRKETRLSQRRAASDLGVSQALLSHYENGAREPKLDFVVRACDYYAVSADYILGRCEERNNTQPLLIKNLREAVSEFQEIKEAADALIEKLRNMTPIDK